MKLQLVLMSQKDVYVYCVSILLNLHLISLSSDDDIRNGQTTDTQNYNQLNNFNENVNQANNRERNSVEDNRGLHEPFKFYDNCYARERNQGELMYMYP